MVPFLPQPQAAWTQSAERLSWDTQLSCSPNRQACWLFSRNPFCLFPCHSCVLKVCLLHYSLAQCFCEILHSALLAATLTLTKEPSHYRRQGRRRASADSLFMLEATTNNFHFNGGQAQVLGHQSSKLQQGRHKALCLTCTIIFISASSEVFLLARLNLDYFSHHTLPPDVPQDLTTCCSLSYHG